MAGKSTPALLVTANVGSIFEDPTVMLKIWIEEFLSTVAKLDPKFIALHCQEVGGKNYERSMKHVEYFVRLLMSSEELRLFDKVRVFLDEDYTSAEHFTALGSFYFIHESISEVFIWDFAEMNFIPMKGKEVHSGNIEGVSTKEKSKFPQDFFPECKWSRKGFLRTRWNVNGTVFDLVNIHLFHDASNFVAMESFPSVYCKNRRRALEHTLERFHNDKYENAPFFVFGDFNFRTNTQGVIKKLAEGLNPVRLQSNKNTDHIKLQYRDGTSQVILSLGKKEFSHQDHQNVFVGNDTLWLKEFDQELEPFKGRLFEFDITFPPSYPFEENEKGAKCYMQTRCPAWCDRVILSSAAKNLVCKISEPGSVEYGLMGIDTCMGDHKPIYLKLDLIADAGIVPCCTFCDDESILPQCFGRSQFSSKNNLCTLSFWSCNESFLPAVDNKLTLNLTTLNNNSFLAPPQSSLLHEPYTPESMDTPCSSPTPIRHALDLSEQINFNFNKTVDSDNDEPGSNNCSREMSETHKSNYHFSQSDLSHISDIPVVHSHKPNISQCLKFDFNLCNHADHMPNDYSNKDSSVLETDEVCLSNSKQLEDKLKSLCNSKSSCEDVQILNDLSNKNFECLSNINKSYQKETSTTRDYKSSRTSSTKRVRLISSSSTNSSRLQSHHSSSDEDWFEEVDSDSADKGDTEFDNDKTKDCFLKITENIDQELSKTVSSIPVTENDDGLNVSAESVESRPTVKAISMLQVGQQNLLEKGHECLNYGEHPVNEIKSGSENLEPSKISIDTKITTSNSTLLNVFQASYIEEPFKSVLQYNDESHSLEPVVQNKRKNCCVLF